MLKYHAYSSLNHVIPRTIYLLQQSDMLNLSTVELGLIAVLHLHGPNKIDIPTPPKNVAVSRLVLAPFQRRLKTFN